MRRIAPLAALLVMTPMLASAAPPQSQVTIVNTPSNPVPVSGNVTVSQPVPQAIQMSCYANCPASDTLCLCEFPAIPSGKLLVIEAISLRGVEYSQAQVTYRGVDLYTWVNGTPGYYHMPVVIERSGPTMTDFFVFLSNTRFYAGPLTTPTLQVYHFVDDEVETRLIGYLSGFYLDKP